LNDLSSRRPHQHHHRLPRGSLSPAPGPLDRFPASPARSALEEL